MKVSDSAKSISAYVESLLTTKVSEVDKKELRDTIDAVNRALEDVRTFVESIEGVADGMSGSDSSSRRESRSGRRGKRRGRSPDDFPVTSFIVQSLRENPEGLRPVDLKDKMKKVAPGRHTNPAATISTTLTRLKRKGVVTNKNGIWKLTRKGRGR